MKSIHTAVLACSALFLCSTAAHASALTGTMLIDPGTRAGPPNADGDPVYIFGVLFRYGGKQPE